MTQYLHPYNPQWPNRYQNESKKIKQVSEIKLNLYHIGSTAISGMYAEQTVQVF